MKLRLDNLVYTVTDPAEIDRLYELGAVPFEEKQPEAEQGEEEEAEETVEEEPKPKGRGKK
ncbi:MAG: hypothetical protein Q4A29_03805 [Eubacteriales bacterium]|nr:hypothetical protein [Eubacteriales bacterium]